MINGPSRKGGAIFLCRPSVTVIALRGHDDAVTMVVTPAAMPVTVVVVHLGSRTIAAVMMAAALDDDGLGVGDRRYRDSHRTQCREHISKLLHGVLLTL